MDNDRHSSRWVSADGHVLRFLFGNLLRPRLFARLALLRPPTALVLHCLAIDFVERLAYSSRHLGRLGQANERMIANLDGDFRDVAVFFQGEDYVRIEGADKEFFEFAQAVFHLLAHCGSDFILPSGVLDVHQTPSNELLSCLATKLLSP